MNFFLLVFERGFIVQSKKTAFIEYFIVLGSTSLQIYKRMAQKIRVKRSAWAEHVQIVELNLPTRKVFSNNPEGDGRPSQSRCRWGVLDNGDERKLYSPTVDLQFPLEFCIKYISCGSMGK